MITISALLMLVMLVALWRGRAVVAPDPAARPLRQLVVARRCRNVALVASAAMVLTFVAGLVW